MAEMEQASFLNQGRGKKLELNRQIDNRHFWGTNYGVILEGEEIEGFSSYIIVNAASPYLNY